MWSVALASNDPATIAALRACLQQTGQMNSIVEWKPTNRGEWQVRPEEPALDIVVLGLCKDDMDELFQFAGAIRKARPTVRIVACAPQQDAELNDVLQTMRSGTQVAFATVAAKSAVQLVMHAMRCGVQEFLPGPATAGMFEELLERFSNEDEAVLVGKGEKLIALTGAKGGVGTTTIAVNLGVYLAQTTKKRVVLLDLARPVGHVPLLLDLHPRYSIRDAVENLDRLDSNFFGGLLTQHKSGLEVLSGLVQPAQWQQITAEALTRVVNVAQSTADFVLLDLGSSYPLDWYAVLRLTSMVLVVAEPNVPSLWALERVTSGLGAIGDDPQWIQIVINRWERKDNESLKIVEKNLNCSICARLPNDFRSASEAMNAGAPLSRNHNGALTSALVALANRIAGKSAVETPRRKWWEFAPKR